MKDQTIDFVCLEPPFNSNASYNVLFAGVNAGRWRVEPQPELEEIE